MMTANESHAHGKDKSSDAASAGIGLQIPSFLRESAIRDGCSWPEKSETNQSKYKRYLMQTKSQVSTQQIKLTQNLDDELFKASKARYRLLMQASESSNACRKILVPRKSTSLLHGTHTVDYAITGGNDMRLRYWSMADPAQNSYYINTPANDECQFHASHVGGGTLYVREQVAAPKQGSKMVIGGTEIELAGDSIYYSVIANLLAQNGSDEEGLSDMWQARNFLSQSSLSDIA